ncbi:sn-glycerol-3-phosphate ABC transporter permease UgpE [Kiloniella laminariae]|uniref:sn-glycerol-3-phosphate ABC transporter permease UgpE n=1 Tax=Kiloniella laminariae TaxID=454162 RepID=UPI00035F5E93|nr:sn-glycerol-3-phosphate ABC transporter permease UgpE [Kiloniella laminariae]
MVENRPLLTFFSHLALIIGISFIALPVWLAFVVSTQEASALFSGQVPLWPGEHFIENYSSILFEGEKNSGAPPILLMITNSLVMAICVAVGKITISIISAYAIVYFQFPFRQAIFWMIFMTLMLPVEVRILPTFEVIAQLGMLNSYAGLTIPLIASATATFLFRQFYMTIPDEMIEAARMDGAGPIRFFIDILLPLSRTNIAALFVILFIFGWNQYLWPLLVTTDASYYTVVMGIQRMMAVPDSDPIWHYVMATAILGMIPPVIVVVTMQKLFVKGLIETEK